MTDAGRQLVERTRRLRLALEDAAGSLKSADLEGLLRSEGTLELALKSLEVPAALAREDRRAMREELQAVRRVLQRCRRLGAALGDVVLTTLDAQGRAPQYARPGTHSAARMRRTLDATG